MQRGQIIKRNGAWHLRHYQTDIVGGQTVRRRVTKKLARVSPAYPTKASVAMMAAEILEPINTGAQTPASAMFLSDFIENVYFPTVKNELRPSTMKAYKKDIFEKHLKTKLKNIRLRDFQVVHGQRVLRQIPGVGHLTLMHIKSFLSSVFKVARREGILGTENPMRDVSVPGRPSRFKGAAYNIQQVEDMLNALPGTARVVVAVAALTGLRVGEIRGLRRNDFDGDLLMVSRSVWRTHVNRPKTLESEAPVPCIPFLKTVLELHCKGKAPDDYIFAGEKGQPLNLANLARRVLKPALEKAKIPWLGWHAFRRGLASNLSALGVQPIVITTIMRHSDPATAVNYYIKVDDTSAREAMTRLENAFGLLYE